MTKFIDSSKLQEFADDNFQLILMKMAEKFSNSVENMVGKRIFAHYEQFLLLLQCFQKTCIEDM